ncbi:MAG: phosphoglycerate kinase [Deltaproteobacteria bacterium]|nr:MAG: phosphoglycerate kinase [Deltaproteobacteria bacterium]
MGIKSIEELELKDKKVLIRVDFNVPLSGSSEITDDSRIRAAIPTIEYAMKQQARVILMSHLGRPKGKVVKEMSLVPVARRLSELLGTSVHMAPDCIGPEVRKMADELRPSGVLLLENLRFHIGEEKNDPRFAKELASLCEVYVNDAFATAHRAHASNVGICKYVKDKAAGFLMLRELEYIEKAIGNPKRPFAAVIGGSKVSGKLEVIENLADKVDKLIIGGGMAFTFVKALGQEVGRSLVEEDLVETAVDIMKKARSRGVKLYLPVDCVCAPRPESNAKPLIRTIQEIPPTLMGLDIGPATSTLFAEALSDCATIVWNGPMGVFEIDAFASGTLQISNSIASSNALTIVGGGDTDAALSKSSNEDKVDFVSTAGGAFLEMLGGKKLPGVEALR